MDYFLEFYKNINRQGPGDDSYTIKALEMIEKLPQKPEILDVGCGSGSQTIALAKHIDCKITALDYYSCFLDELKENIKKEGFENRITPVEGSMFEMNFKKASFDIIWSEGAIYIMGFENGIKSCSKFLKPKGSIVFSELTWLTQKDVIPKEIYDFWTAEYPEMGTISEKIAVIEKCGLRPTAHIILPDFAWTENYYKSLAHKKELFLKEYGSQQEAVNVVLSEYDKEFDLFNRFSKYYGYVFYVMERE